MNQEGEKKKKSNQQSEKTAHREGEDIYKSGALRF